MIPYCSSGLSGLPNPASYHQPQNNYPPDEIYKPIDIDDKCQRACQVESADHPETEQIRIGKFRRDYNPMIAPEKMQEIINATGDERKQIIDELSNEKSEKS